MLALSPAARWRVSLPAAGGPATQCPGQVPHSLPWPPRAPDMRCGGSRRKLTQPLPPCPLSGLESRGSPDSLGCAETPRRSQCEGLHVACQGHIPSWAAICVDTQQSRLILLPHLEVECHLSHFPCLWGSSPPRTCSPYVSACPVDQASALDRRGPRGAASGVAAAGPLASGWTAGR